MVLAGIARCKACTRCALPLARGLLQLLGLQLSTALLCRPSTPPFLWPPLPTSLLTIPSPYAPTHLLQLVRRWDPQLLVPAAGPLLCHHHSVRTLAAGGRELLVSGDKNGEVALWKV